jgi:hypothetical protein
MKSWEQMTADEKLDYLRGEILRLERRIETVSNDANGTLLRMDERIKKLEKKK